MDKKCTHCESPMRSASPNTTRLRMCTNEKCAHREIDSDRVAYPFMCRCGPCLAKVKGYSMNFDTKFATGCKLCDSKAANISMSREFRAMVSECTGCGNKEVYFGSSISPEKKE